MEILKLYVDFKVLNKTVNSSFLNHLFELIEPDTSIPLQIYFSTSEDNDEELKQAYKQVYEYLYGWKGISLSSKFYETSDALIKNARKIEFIQDVEIVECERLIKIFEALFQRTRREASKKILELDGTLDMFGKGQNTFEGTPMDLPVSKSKAQLPLTTDYTPSILQKGLFVIAEEEEEEELHEIAVSAAPTADLIASKSMSKEIAEDKSISISTSNANMDILLVDLDDCLDVIFLAITELIFILTMSEVCGKKDIHTKYLAFGNEIGTDFITYTLSTTWKLLSKDESFIITFAEFKNLDTLEFKLSQFFADSTHRHLITSLAPKLRGLHQVFASMDVLVFPEFICAHPSGASVKGLDSSSLDPNLWISGGYDGLIRIHELHTPYTCYGQFVGHKSIITDVKFAKVDMVAISSSFDRTLKVWNTTNAQVIKTLSGNDEAVLSCDITNDGRFAISGGLDCTVRFWDVNAGFQISCIRKHTKWVKVVRFSHDAKYFASAGLDAKIYVWDTKLCSSNSKSIEPMRTIDNHMDIILDIALFRPSLLLSTSRDRTIRLFDFVSGREIYCNSLGSNRWGCAVDFSHDGKLFAVGTSDQNVFLFNTQKCQKIRQVRMFNMGIVSIRFPKKENIGYLVVGTAEGFIQKLVL